MEVYMPLRISFISSACLSIMLVCNWRGEVAAITVTCQSNLPAAEDGAQDLKEDRKPSAIKLPRANLAPVPDELTAPIGIASQDRPILETLETRRLSLDVREVRLGDVIDNVRDQVGCNILVDQPALEEEGVTLDTPVTAHLKDAQLGRGLNRILEQYNLTYLVTHGVILITSQLESGNSLVFQVYPVADLVWRGEPNGEQVIDFEPLVKTLQEAIFPNSWSCVGGAGTVQPFVPSLSLAINQTRAAHEGIPKVLASLRKARLVTDQSKPSTVAHEARKPKTQLSDRDLLVASEREIEIQRTTRELIITLNFNQLPLSEAIHFLSECSNLPIDLDRPSLEEEGVTVDTPISMKVSGVRLDDALHLLLRQYNLTWTVKHDVIFITSQLTAGNDLSSHCYPVRDLVVLSTDEARWSVFHDQLQEIIENVVSPNSWSKVGGAGTVNYFPASQCLTISQTQSVHEQISALLAALRESAERYSEITRLAGMPAPEKLAEVQLRAVRAVAESAK
jgi:hypothetical protein